MRNGKRMKQNKYRLIAWCVCVWMVMSGYAQDPLPRKAKADTHSTPVYVSKEIKQLLKLLTVESPMPDSFKGVQENEIFDPTFSLAPFWKKLCKLEKPVRIVHIGDSHVRGHVFPYIVRSYLEEDFGRNAVEPIPLTYQTSGIAKETGNVGVVYHVIGVNGATCGTYATEERMREVTSLQPDLVILSFGTNEAHGRRYAQTLHTVEMKHLIDKIKSECPNVTFLLTTPPGAYVRNGRRGRVINPRTSLVVDTQLKFAEENQLAVWDMYHVAGGSQYACRNWTAAHLFQRDKIHFTREGYILQGLLLHEALIKEYNKYVGNRLE